MTIPTIDEVTALNRLTGADNYPADADQFSQDLEASIPQMNISIGFMNSTAVTIDADSTSAAASAASASADAGAATSSANFKGDYTALGAIALTVPSAVFSLNTYWNLLEDVADISLEVPGTSSKWEDVNTQTTGIQLSGGGVINSRKVSILTDAGAYTVPDSDNFAIGYRLIIDRLSRYQNFSPTLTMFAGDTVESNQGTNTVINFQGQGLIQLILTKTAVNEWSA